MGKLLVCARDLSEHVQFECLMCVAQCHARAVCCEPTVTSDKLHVPTHLPFSQAALSSYGGMSAAASYGLSAAGGGMAAGGYGGASGSSLPTVYDPLADVSLEKLNAAFIQRNLPLLSRNFMRFL